MSSATRTHTRPPSASTRTSAARSTRPSSSLNSSLTATAQSRSSPNNATLTRTRTRPAASASHTWSSSSSSLTSSPFYQSRGDEMERELIAARLVPAMDRTKEEKEAIVEALAAEQNGYLLMLLEKEQANEAERSRILAAVDDVGDQRRLEKIFAIERAKASATLKNVTRQHERELALKLHELGLISDEEDDEHYK